jgi:uncharacterized protein (DUF1330 family)
MGYKWSLTKKQCAAISKRKMGHAVSEETRRKISEKLKGSHLSPEARRKVSEALKGKHKSPEAVAHMTLYQRNRNPGHNENISKGLMGKVVTMEHIEHQRRSKLANGVWKPIGHVYERGGYRWIKVADGKRRMNYLAEHRYIIEKMIGRPLCSDEHVHHLDGNSLNNSPDNLAVISKRDHTLITKFLRCMDEGLARVIIGTLTKRFPDRD